MKRLLSTFALAGAFGLAAVSAQAATKLEQVKSKGFVQCGVSQGLPGFSSPDDQGHWTGLDVDFCRAVSAAVFGDPDKVKFTPLSAKDRFTALQSGDIDILSRNTTWTITRDTSLGLNFAGVTYYDGQGFMIRKDKKVNSALELSGASVCTQTGTTTEQNLADFFRANNMTYEVIAFATNDEVVKAYDAGRCDVLTTDRSGLAGERLKLTNPDDHIVLPEIISKEPLGPVVSHGDDQWFDIVKWVLYAQIDAEELGVSSKNVDDQLKSATNPEIRRLLGLEGKYGEGMGIDNAWAYNIIKSVGNYGEMYDRNVGPDTPLKLPRGVNALWTKGGIQYGMPIR
ncbi:amino acid ABC transporter substrate-binding protein [Ancylobacter mangrovi]|uniref:Amino acid ABC transporter substrate-binding protein n=1 Tax=Ancylobacter mangrovi TaxID=2972472 RepID=A0A9X2PAV2_9HYPH|nr:amino acid ABC transporter substrate-binding protein [Ancylobacter mangrovi]MCS0493516.1 amino acid ABC transporter substrate-binding protein [Ancylobacter mangrovi]MCS0501866.1 amino acid ABC transporter substrate-binding protein [Ancylobacter mangrovi]